MRTHLHIAIRFTLITTVIFGIIYPLTITAIAHFAMHDKANGQLMSRNGVIIGSRIIGQKFTSDIYFHGRPSAAGNGYDAANSGGSNLAPSNALLVEHIQSAVAAYQTQNPGQPVPIDLVTSSASGIDPDISPAAALYQVHTVAAARHIPQETVRKLVDAHIQGRQYGLLGEPRVNVLELNLALDALPH